ncbi:MAG: cupin-like domain-containing protein, partial [Bradymonadaceae bacterium]
MKVKRVSSDELTRREFFQQYFHPSRPVVIEGEAEGAKATKHWSPDYLKSALGGNAVQMAFQNEGLFDKNGFWVDEEPEWREVEFAEASRRICEDGRHYVLAEAFDADGIRKAIADFGVEA